MAIGFLGEVLQDFSAVPAGDGFGCPVQPWSAAGRGRKDTDDAQFIPAEIVGGLALVAGVADQRVDQLALSRRNERVGELEVIGLGASIDEGREDQVCLGVADG